MQRTKDNHLLIIFILIVVLCISLIFADQAGAVVVASTTPAHKSEGVPTNTQIRIQFDKTLNTPFTKMEVEEDSVGIIEGTVQFATTSIANDTMIFIPERALKSGTHYHVDGHACIGQSCECIGYDFDFMTKGSTADVVPPSVESTIPYEGMTGFPVGGTILYSVQ